MLLLETQLSRRPEYRRQQIAFMHEFFRNFPHLELVAKQVHSLADLKKFLDLARRDRTVKAIHIVAHWEHSRRRTTLVLTGGEIVDLTAPQARRLFRNLKTDVVYFSCCQLGRDGKLMRQLLRTSGAKAIFSYLDDLNDYQAFITESLFYHLAYGYVHGRASKLPLDEVYERLKLSLNFLGIDSIPDSLSTPLLQADFA